MESKTTYKSVRCDIGNRVRILTSQKAEDPNTYRVESKERNLLNLLCESTGKIVPVHVSRVIRNLDSNEETVPMNPDSNPSTTPDATATIAAPTKPAKAAKPAKAKVTNANAPKTAKKKRLPLSWKTLLASAGEGAERYVSKIETFDHKHMETRKNIVVRGDRRAYVTFNTYDGSLGAKAGDFNTNPVFEKMGTVYPLADDAAYEKYIARQKASGYTRVSS